MSQLTNKALKKNCKTLSLLRWAETLEECYAWLQPIYNHSAIVKTLWNDKLWVQTEWTITVLMATEPRLLPALLTETHQWLSRVPTWHEVPVCTPSTCQSSWQWTVSQWHASHLHSNRTVLTMNRGTAVNILTFHKQRLCLTVLLLMLLVW